MSDAIKPRYAKGVPVHLQDQAVQDAMLTTRRRIEAAIALTHRKTRA